MLASFLGTRQPPSQGWSRWWGWGKSREGHTDLRVSGAAMWEGGGLSSARAMPNAKLRVGGSGWGRQENQGLDLTAPRSIFPLPFQLQPWPHPFFSPQLKEQPLPRAASFLLILAPGLMDPRLGTSRAMEVGAVGASGVSIPRINTCRSTHPLLPLPSS